MKRAPITILLVLSGMLVLPLAADAGVTYVVRPGDTLYQISLRYGVPVGVIVSVNRLDDPSRITPGQVLKIPETRKRGSPHAGSAGSGRSAGTRQSSSRGVQPAVIAVHRVRSGDTLLGIAARYRVTVDAIKQANGLWTDVILPGQRLAIPTRESVAVLARRHMPAPQPIPVPRVAFARTVKAGSRADRIIQDAKRYLGIRYVWGAASTRGLDCSGLIYAVFSRYVPSLGRLRTYDYFGMGSPVAPQALLPGDLVFFTTDAPGPSHMGIFIGDGQFIHASSVAGGVTITSLDDPFYRERFLGVRRFVNP